MIFCNGQYHSCLFTSYNENNGEVRKKARFLTLDEIASRMLRKSRADPSNVTSYTAMIQHDDEHCAPVTEEGLEKVLQHLGATAPVPISPLSTSSSSLSSSALTGRAGSLDTFQVVRAYVHPFLGLRYSCSYLITGLDTGFSALRAQGRAAFTKGFVRVEGGATATTVTATAPTTTTTTMSSRPSYMISTSVHKFIDRYNVLPADRNYFNLAVPIPSSSSSSSSASSASTSLPDDDLSASLSSSSYTPVHSILDSTGAITLPDVLRRECERVTLSFVAYLTRAHALSVRAIDCEFVQDFSKRLILTAVDGVVLDRVRPGLLAGNAQGLGDAQAGDLAALESWVERRGDVHSQQAQHQQQKQQQAVMATGGTMRRPASAHTRPIRGGALTAAGALDDGTGRSSKLFGRHVHEDEDDDEYDDDGDDNGGGYGYAGHHHHHHQRQRQRQRQRHLHSQEQQQQHARQAGAGSRLYNSTVGGYNGFGGADGDVDGDDDDNWDPEVGNDLDEGLPFPFPSTSSSSSFGGKAEDRSGSSARATDPRLGGHDRSRTGPGPRASDSADGTNVAVSGGDKTSYASGFAGARHMNATAPSSQTAFSGRREETASSSATAALHKGRPASASGASSSSTSTLMSAGRRSGSVSRPAGLEPPKVRSHDAICDCIVVYCGL